MVQCSGEIINWDFPWFSSFPALHNVGLSSFDSPFNSWQLTIRGDHQHYHYLSGQSRPKRPPQPSIHRHGAHAQALHHFQHSDFLMRFCIAANSPLSFTLGSGVLGFSFPKYSEISPFRTCFIADPSPKEKSPKITAGAG